LKELLFVFDLGLGDEEYGDDEVEEGGDCEY
jgi:hypothetical protein